MKTLILFFSLCLVSVCCFNQSVWSKNIQVDNILVQKSNRLMFLRQGNTIIRSYKISLGDNPIGPKEKEGDEKTPEGTYKITYHNPHSSYHLSLRISYPTPEQKKQARQNGYSAGGDIMIHGYPNWAIDSIFDMIHQTDDWTDGCIAVTNKEIEEIYHLVKDGTPITINP
ncbi:MAG: L,D-transpeptidase family protein [Alphaproteobacteria bacterium]|nr:L,D-transpeptidase family protein [Alphaproteobacteria bacterium]